MLYQYYTEIKSRVSLLLVSGFCTFLVGYTYKEVLLNLAVSLCSITSTQESSYFIFTDVVEVFNVYVCLIFFVTKQVLLFHFFYHLLIFIAPGLTHLEYRYLKIMLTTSSSLFIVSVILFIEFLFPFSWNFFLSFTDLVSFSSLTLHFEAKLMDYILFFFNLYFSCILYFQFFLFPIFFFTYFGRKLSGYTFFRKLLFYVCVIFSTLVTPPDVTSQIILSITLIVGCEILVYVFLLKSVVNKKLIR